MKKLTVEKAVLQLISDIEKVLKLIVESEELVTKKNGEVVDNN